MLDGLMWLNLHQKNRQLYIPLGNSIQAIMMREGGREGEREREREREKQGSPIL